MPKRIALVALGRSVFPTGKTVLTGELAEDVSVASVERALANGAVEFESLPDLPVRSTVEGPQTTALPRPLPALPAAKPTPPPAPKPKSDPKPAAKPPAQPSAPPKPHAKTAATSAPRRADPDPLAGNSPAEIRSELGHARREDEAKRKEAEEALEEEARKLAEANSHKQLVKLGKKENATFSARGSKLAIATEIVESRQASS